MKTIESKIITLEAEIDRLKKEILFKDRHIRELEREINDYVVREKHLMKEIDDLTPEDTPGGRPQKLHLSPQTGSLEEFLNPKLPTTSPLKNDGSNGLEEEWEDFMYAYTDDIFVEANTPDVLLYRDDEEQCYKSITGRTCLQFPIKQSDLDFFNFVKVRPVTSAELKQICKDYEL